MYFIPDILRRELSDDGERTVLVLYHRFADWKQAPSYASGWHLCLDGLIGLLAGKKMPCLKAYMEFSITTLRAALVK
ncbi:hypothetical protein ACE3NQ_23855 [Paenibacillus terreus]|uniref:Uncharacterized protein n=1 Tax=Paenibacillus terreus TaxID=1387834 RepID=A0ABV5BE37_9BACL